MVFCNFKINLRLTFFQIYLFKTFMVYLPFLLDYKHVYLVKYTGRFHIFYCRIKDSDYSEKYRQKRYKNSILLHNI